MFFQFKDKVMSQTNAEDIDPEVLTIGYTNVEELAALSGRFGFDESTVEACRDASELFRSGVEVHADYTFTQLRILNDKENSADDCIALFMKRNFMLVVDICDADGSTRSKYLSAIEKYPAERMCVEKVLAAFLDSLIAGDYMVLETIESGLDAQEQALLEKRIDKDFNARLLKTKSLLSKRHTYYAQLQDVTEAVCENDNLIFEESRLIYVDNVSKRIARLCEDTVSLRSSVEHLQDAYSSYLDSDMNRTMKVLTVLTSIFYPLTIIVGWYGMNFKYMPELAWKYGYVYVILLSVLTVLLFAIIGKKKKWF